MNSPVEQFTIKVLYNLNIMGIDISFTNASLFMILSILFSYIFLMLLCVQQFDGVFSVLRTLKRGCWGSKMHVRYFSDSDPFLPTSSLSKDSS